MARGNKLNKLGILWVDCTCAPYLAIRIYSRTEIYYVDHKIKVEAGTAEIGWANRGSQRR
jgi:hypothetical protein